MDISTLCTIFIGGVAIGIFAVVMGGTLFLSLPLFQTLFPDMALAAIVGNIKLGSIFRNATALIPIRTKLDPKSLWLAPILCLGSILGSWQVVSVTQAVVPIVLVIGFAVHEYGKKIHLPNHLFWPVAFAVGYYGGIFGAGIMLLILSLLRLRQKDVVDARANALLLELLLSVMAVVTFWHFNLINWPLALTWASGGMIGGYIGGIVIEKTGKLSPATQDWLIRAAFLIALCVATLRALRW
jgi:uncharacterized membrane protein YfcA